MADDGHFFEVVRGDDVGEFANMAREIFFEDRHEIEEEFAVVINTRKELRESRLQIRLRADLYWSLFAFLRLNAFSQSVFCCFRWLDNAMGQRKEL